MFRGRWMRIGVVASRVGIYTALVLLLIIWVLVINREQAWITKSTCDRIEPGMTEQDVEDLIGCPADDRYSNSLYWRGERAEIQVWLDNGRKVTKAEYRRWPAETVLDRVLAWLDR